MNAKITNNTEQYKAYAVSAKIPEFSDENTNGAILCCIAQNPRIAKMKLYKALRFFGVKVNYIDLRACQMDEQKLAGYKQARKDKNWETDSNFAAWYAHHLILYHPIESGEKAAV